MSDAAPAEPIIAAHFARADIRRARNDAWREECRQANDIDAKIAEAADAYVTARDHGTGGAPQAYYRLQIAIREKRRRRREVT